MYQICVSGASRGQSVNEGQVLATHLGRALAKAGQALLTGAAGGLPDTAAQAYKAAGGKVSVGISPAASKVEHVVKYRLPTEAYDAILYSGLHYVGRDTLLITSSDAAISLGGRLGTLHEFAIAMETETPIAFLSGAGGIGDEIQSIISAAKPLPRGAQTLFGDSAEQLVDDLISLLDKMHSKYPGVYR